MILYADTSNGVFLNGDDDMVTDEVVEGIFLDCLHTLHDGEYLKSWVKSLAILKKIHEKYEIKRG